MKANLLQMRAGRTTAETFLRRVPTVEREVSFTVTSIANEDGSCRMCEVQLPNQEPGAGRHCIALLAPEHVDELIGALTAWRALP
jgi:hypothetical protein